MQEIKLKILEEYRITGNNLMDIIDSVLRDSPLSTNQLMKLREELYNEIEWYGKLTPFIKDEKISEIMVNGIHSIYIERNGKIEKTNLKFDSEDQLMQIVYKIAGEVNREINLSHPILDARLRDGSRVNVIMEPLSKIGTVMTIRKFKKTFTDIFELVKVGMLSKELASFLRTLVKCKYNIFICGGTGSGKTTVLNCLANEIPKEERVITIEDAAEIDLSKVEHKIILETKRSKQSQHCIGMNVLIKNALRMRPDRIIVGEVRGEEVVEMLQAMNTGHEGSFSTGHANSAFEMLTRLEVIASHFAGMRSELIKKQIISAIDIIIFVERLPNGTRRIGSVYEVEKAEEYRLHELYNEGILHQEIKNKSKYEKYADYMES